jgi:hypothetical protein
MSQSCGSDSVDSNVTPPDHVGTGTPLKQPARRVGPQTHVSVVAFEAGRLFNELRFHLIQAWLYAPNGEGDVQHAAQGEKSGEEGLPSTDEIDASGHSAVSDRVSRDLGRMARYLRRTAEDREKIQNNIQQVIVDCLWQTKGLQQSEDFIRMFDAHKSPWNHGLSEGDQTPYDEIRRFWLDDFCRGAHEQLDHIRESLTSGLDEMAKLGFELGELLDQRVRGKRIEDELIIPPPPCDPTSSVAGSYSVVGRVAGELPCDPGWAGDMEQIASELSLDGALSGGLLTALTGAHGDEAVSLVGDLARTLHDALAGNQTGVRTLKGGEAAVGPMPGTSPGNGDTAAKTRFARGQFAYDLCNDTSLIYKKARELFNARAGKEGWKNVLSDEGLVYVAKEHMTNHKLAKINPRPGKE